MNKFTKAAFKFLDLIVIFVMTFGSPMSAMAQDAGPSLTTNQADYAPGDSAYITGTSFTAGDYTLRAMEPGGNIADWGPVTVSEGGGFTIISPSLIAEGAYELRAYASDWASDWSEAAIATVSL